MLIQKAPDLTYADITPKSVYLDRRRFLRAVGIIGATLSPEKASSTWPCRPKRRLPRAVHRPG